MRQARAHSASLLERAAPARPASAAAGLRNARASTVAISKPEALPRQPREPAKRTRKAVKATRNLLTPRNSGNQSLKPPTCQAPEQRSTSDRAARGSRIDSSAMAFVSPDRVRTRSLTDRRAQPAPVTLSIPPACPPTRLPKPQTPQPTSRTARVGDDDGRTSDQAGTPRYPKPAEHPAHGQRPAPP